MENQRRRASATTRMDPSHNELLAIESPRPSQNALSAGRLNRRDAPQQPNSHYIFYTIIMDKRNSNKFFYH